MNQRADVERVLTSVIGESGQRLVEPDRIVAFASEDGWLGVGVSIEPSIDELRRMHGALAG